MKTDFLTMSIDSVPPTACDGVTVQHLRALQRAARLARATERREGRRCIAAGYASEALARLSRAEDTTSDAWDTYNAAMYCPAKCRRDMDRAQRSAEEREARQLADITENNHPASQ